MSYRIEFLSLVITSGLLLLCSTVFAGEGMDRQPGTLTIFGYQMMASTNVAQNEQRIMEAITKAAEAKADFLVTPEGSLSGYTPNFDGRQVAEAEKRIAEAAGKAKVGLILGTCYAEQVGDKEYRYNQARVYAPDGTFLGVHSKIMLCSSLEYPGTGEMSQFVEGVLRTFEWNGVKFGILICNDLWATPGYATKPNPYLPWRLKQMGAELIIQIISSGANQIHRAFHESSAELWALALKTNIVQVNACYGEKAENSATSGVVAPDTKRPVTVPRAGEQMFTYVFSSPRCPATQPSGHQRTSRNVERVLAMPGLVAFWDFQEEGGQDRVSKGPAPRQYRLREQSGKVERIEPLDGAPFGPYAARLNQGQWLLVPREELGELDIHGKQAQVTVVAWIKRHNSEKAPCEAVAGVWDEVRHKRQYCLFLDIGLNKNHPDKLIHDKVSGHISDVGGPTPGYPWCYDVAQSKSSVPYNQWVCVGFTYDGQVIRAYYNGQFEEHEGYNPYPFPNGIYDAGLEGVGFKVGVSDETNKGSHNWFTGIIGGIAVFKRALGNQEMSQLAQAVP